MKILSVIQNMLLASLMMLFVAACMTTTAFDNAVTASAVIEIDNRFDDVHASALKVANDEQRELIANIAEFKEVIYGIMKDDEVDPLYKAEMAAQVEAYYLQAKASYIKLKATIDVSSLDPQAKWQMKRFDANVRQIDSYLAKVSAETKFEERKRLAYQTLEMLINTLNMVNLTRV